MDSSGQSEEENDTGEKKSAPITATEKLILFSLIGENKDVESKKTEFGVLVDNKKIAWEEIAAQFSSQPNCSRRTGTQIKTWWTNQKKRAKKNVTKQKKLIRKTGGGPKPPELPPDTDKVMSIVPCQLSSLTNDFDCDEDEVETDLQLQDYRQAQAIAIVPEDAISMEKNLPNYSKHKTPTEFGMAKKKRKERNPRSSLVDFEFEEHQIRLKTLHVEYETAMLKKTLAKKQLESFENKNALEIQILQQKLSSGN